mmetsp:Transcript_25454/g.43288  ORF Transcript_25454/g.43288 Transcript_25454/m.43288 type:complete len:154 (-) Transcript_25454:172-633(-)
MSIMATIEVPQAYGYVMFSCVLGPFVANMIMSENVMTARKECDVQYPNLYAAPGFHKKADEFNRVQRGHQNMFESLPLFVPMSLLGGLKHPITIAVFGVLYTLGSILYQRGYMDTQLDVQKARHLKGGPIRVIAVFGSVVPFVSMAGTILGWW